MAESFFNQNKIEQKSKLELMREILVNLENELKNGNFLHGTKVDDLTELVPKQANDYGRDGGPTNMNGIYAEKYDVRIPIVMALFDKVDKTKYSKSGYTIERKTVNDIERGCKIIKGENVMFTDGYIYVLPADTFTLHEDDRTREYISIVPVKVLRKYKITPEIIELLKNTEVVEE